MKTLQNLFPDFLKILLTTFVIFTAIEDSPAQTNNNSLDQIADTFLGNWVGEVKGPNDESVTSELVFEWTLNKKFIKVTNLLGPKRSLFALTFYGKQPVLNRIVFWSFDNEGTISEGIVEFKDSTLKHEWRSFGSNGEIKDWRSNLIRHDENTATFTIQGEVSFSVNYKRLIE
ncbi:hypothetical protein IID10_05715 [candidate division KSB1 bacterium]|nr:hypothetical protein [candidate division KSB1 bacterium]TDI90397.1 MAG: hypothetical protein E2O77_08310 [Caldithrix sp.]